MAGPAAQITICGDLKTATIAALVEVAMQAGAALLVQPRELTPHATRLLTGDVLDARVVRRTVKRRKQVAPRRSQLHPEALAGEHDAIAVAFLRKHGPVRPPVLSEHLGLSKLAGRAVFADMEKRGVVELTGATLSRRVGLPGQAKEAP